VVKTTPRKPEPAGLRPGRRRTLPPRALGAAAVRAARQKRDVDMAAAFGSEGRSSGDRGWEGGGREWDVRGTSSVWAWSLYNRTEGRGGSLALFPLATSSPLISSALASRFFCSAVLKSSCSGCRASHKKTVATAASGCSSMFQFETQCCDVVAPTPQGRSWGGSSGLRAGTSWPTVLVHAWLAVPATPGDICFSLVLL
jgi:hypothetical protein